MLLKLGEIIIEINDVIPVSTVTDSCDALQSKQRQGNVLLLSGALQRARYLFTGDENLFSYRDMKSFLSGFERNIMLIRNLNIYFKHAQTILMNLCDCVSSTVNVAVTVLTLTSRMLEPGT